MLTERDYRPSPEVLDPKVARGCPSPPKDYADEIRNTMAMRENARSYIERLAKEFHQKAEHLHTLLRYLPAVLPPELEFSLYGIANEIRR